MKLNENWRRILGKSWSLRLVALIGALQVIDAVLPLLVGATLPPGALKALSILAAIGAAAARIMAQPDIERRRVRRDAAKGPT